MSEYTSKHGTETKEGVIPHLKINNLRMPVMLDLNSKKVDGLYSPLRENGVLVYATPGCGKYTPS